MGFFSSLFFGIIEGHQQAKLYEISQANAHLQSMSDQLNVMRHVCDNSDCEDCRYGTSPTACEFGALVHLYKKTINDYEKRKLIKKS